MKDNADVGPVEGDAVEACPGRSDDVEPAVLAEEGVAVMANN